MNKKNKQVIPTISPFNKSYITVMTKIENGENFL